MRYLLLILLVLTSGCFYSPATEEEEMANRNPPVAKIPPLGVPQVSPIIPRDGLWTGYNQLGYQAKYGPDNRGTQTVLKLDEWGPPEVWTVSLFLRENFEAFDGINIIAEINFGAGGSSQTILVDWLNGAQISLPLNAVNVIAHFEDVDIITEGRSIEVGVQLARGARGGTMPPVLTLVEDTDVAFVAKIPEFAREIVVCPSSNASGELASFFSADFTLRLLSGNDIGTHTVNVANGAAAVGGCIRIPVVGQGRVLRAAHAGAGTAPHFTVFAVLDG